MKKANLLVINSKEIENALNNFLDLTYEKKIKLKNQIDDLGIKNDKTDLLNSNIQEEKKKISNFEYLDTLGFNIIKNESGVLFKRSEKGNQIDILAVILGLFSIPILLFVTIKILILYELNNLSLINIIPMLILIVIGIFSFVLLIKGIERKIEYHNFEILRKDTEFRLKIRNNFTLEEKKYPLSSKFKFEANGEGGILYLIYSNIKIKVLNFKRLNMSQFETMEALVYMLNNPGSS